MAKMTFQPNNHWRKHTHGFRSYEDESRPYCSEKKKSQGQKGIKCLSQNRSRRRSTRFTVISVSGKTGITGVYTRPAGVSATALGLMYVVRTKREPVRIGFVTTEAHRQCRGANRARRLMKEVYRLHRHELSSHYEAILLAAAFLTTATYGEAEKALLALWRKAGMLEGHDEDGADRSYSILQEICFSSETAMLPFHSHLQHLRWKRWRNTAPERRMARAKADLEVPSFP